MPIPNTAPTDATAGKTDKVPNRHVSLLVLGPSGSGKSTFIATASGKGKHADIVSHDIESYTSTCIPHTFTDSKHNTTVTLIDSPGFNDTNRDDLDILKSIADFLTTTISTTTTPQPLITGIILTHPITQNRMTGSARLNLAAVKALCGEPFYHRVVVLTTMWDTIPSQMRDECIRREGQIVASTALWGDLVAGGARVMRFYGSLEATSRVFEQFISSGGFGSVDDDGYNKGEEKRALMMSASSIPSLSLVNELGTGMSLEETSAGRVLVEEKKRRKKAHDEEVQRLEKLIEEEKAQLKVMRGGGEAGLHGDSMPIERGEREARGHRAVERVEGEGHRPVHIFIGEHIMADERRNHNRGGRERREAGEESGLVGNVLSGMVEKMTRRFQH